MEKLWRIHKKKRKKEKERERELTERMEIADEGSIHRRKRKFFTSSAIQPELLIQIGSNRL